MSTLAASARAAFDESTGPPNRALAPASRAQLVRRQFHTSLAEAPNTSVHPAQRLTCRHTQTHEQGRYDKQHLAAQLSGHDAQGACFKY